MSGTLAALVAKRMLEPEEQTINSAVAAIVKTSVAIQNEEMVQKWIDAIQAVLDYPGIDRTFAMTQYEDAKAFLDQGKQSGVTQDNWDKLNDLVTQLGSKLMPELKGILEKQMETAKSLSTLLTGAVASQPASLLAGAVSSSEDVRHQTATPAPAPTPTGSTFWQQHGTKVLVGGAVLLFGAGVTLFVIKRVRG